MRLTQHTDYGLRLLMYVALKNGQRCTIREAAESFAISRNHLRPATGETGKHITPG